jgi:hypothetical protein
MKPRHWYLLRVRTAGLLATVNLGQAYDRTNACLTCGAGARPIPPLIAELSRMGKKVVDCTAHDGRLITTRGFADALRTAGVTGFAEQPVRSRGSERPHPGFVWLDVTAEWAPFAASTRLEREDVCPRCGRAGHFDLRGGGTRLVSHDVPDTACDFNVTWEYFGVWRTAMIAEKRSPVGGARYLIVSARTRELFMAHKVKHVSFHPLEYESGSAAIVGAPT